jgi:hypothetical protein
MNKINYSRLLLIVLIFLVFFSSCSNSERKEKKIEIESLTQALGKISVNSTFKWIVVLPGLGCDGCIQEGEAFMKKHIENKEILFVLTKIYSIKILEQKIGVDVSEHTNIYIDRINEFDIPTMNSIYPCIIRIKDGKIVSYEFQSPINGMAFNKLQNLI